MKHFRLLIVLLILLCISGAASAEPGVLTLPEGLTSIEAEAFLNTSAYDKVILPDGLQKINIYAFAGSSITEITFPASVSFISFAAFDGCDGLTAYVIEGSYAHKWCTDHEIPCTATPAPSTPAEDFSTRLLADGTLEITGYTGIDTVVFIPESIGGVKVTSIGSSCFLNQKYCTISLPDTITHIGDSAFSGCYNLTSITIPDGVTSIGDSTFSGCFYLTSITIPDGVTSIGNSAFSDCYSLNSITIPDGVTSISDSTFSGCSNLTGITIPDGVTSIGNSAFSDCSSLISITIPGKVSCIAADAFSGCYKLTASVENGSYAHKWCYENSLPFTTTPAEHFTTALLDDGTLAITGYTGTDAIVSIPACIDGITVTAIGDNAFSGQTSLCNVTLTRNITSIGLSAFSGCTTLQSINLPVCVYYIAEDAFVGCSLLSAQVIEGSYAHEWCVSNKIPCSVFPVSTPVKAFRTDTLEDGTLEIWDYTGEDTVISIPGSIDGVQVSAIGSYSFAWSGKLQKVILPDGIASIGDSAFSGCGSLTSITLPDSVTSIGDSAFSGCWDLTSIALPDSVASIGDSAFSGCWDLTSINIPDGITSIGDSTFLSCESLTTITLPDSVASIGDSAFAYCRKLTSISIPDSVTSIGNYVFDSCALNSISLPESLISIGEGTFYRCGSLKEINIPASVASIGTNAFTDCNRLFQITIPGSVTSIEAGAFESCDGLLIARIPASVTSIGANAFTGEKLNIFGFSTSAAEAYALSAGVPFYSEHDSVEITAEVTSGNARYELTYSKKGTEENKTCIIVAISSSTDSMVIDANQFIYGCKIIGMECEGLFDGVQMITRSPIRSLTINGDVEFIGKRAFWDCEELETVTINGNVGTIRDYAFYECSSLTSFTVNGSVGKFQSVFSACPALKSLEVTEGAIVLAGSLGGRNLESITCPDGLIFAGGSLSGSQKLTSVHLSEKNTAISDHAFDDCTALTNIFIPEGVTYIGDSAFRWCTGLTDIVIPESVDIIGEYAFDGCTNLANITLPKQIDDIGSYCFRDCRSLQFVRLPDGLKSIGASTFGNCRSLQAVYIPPTVTYISQMQAGAYQLAAFYHYYPEWDLYTDPEILIYGAKGTAASSFGGSYYFREGDISAICRSGEYLYSLTEVETDSGIQYECRIAQYLGSNANILLPEELDGYPVTGIERAAFRDFSPNYINIPDTIRTIGDMAFHDARKDFYIICSMNSVGQTYAQKNGHEFLLTDNNPAVSGLYETTGWPSKLTPAIPGTLLVLNNNMAEKLWAVDAYTYFADHPLQALLGINGESILFPGAAYDEYYEKAALATLYYLCDGHKTDAQNTIDALKIAKKVVDVSKFTSSIHDAIMMKDDLSRTVGDWLGEEYLNTLPEPIRSSLEEQILTIDVSAFDLDELLKPEENWEGILDALNNSGEAIIDMLILNTYRNVVLTSLESDLEELLLTGGNDERYTAVFTKVLADLRKDRELLGKECFLKAMVDSTQDFNFAFGVWGRATEDILDGNTEWRLFGDAFTEEFVSTLLLDIWMPGKVSKLGFNIGTATVQAFLFDADEIGEQMRNFTLGYMTLSNAHAQLSEIVDALPMMATKSQMNKALDSYMLYYKTTMSVYAIGNDLINAIYSTDFSTYWNGRWSDDPAGDWLMTLSESKTYLVDNYKDVIDWYNHTLGYIID